MEKIKRMGKIVKEIKNKGQMIKRKEREQKMKLLLMKKLQLNVPKDNLVFQSKILKNKTKKQ